MISGLLLLLHTQRMHFDASMCCDTQACVWSFCLSLLNAEVVIRTTHRFTIHRIHYRRPRSTASWQRLPPCIESKNDKRHLLFIIWFAIYFRCTLIAVLLSVAVVGSDRIGLFDPSYRIGMGWKYVAPADDTRAIHTAIHTDHHGYTIRENVANTRKERRTRKVTQKSLFP